MAENQTAAETEAESLIGEDGANIIDMVMAHEVKKIDDIPIEWRNSLPFEDDSNKTCTQIIQNI